MIITDNLIATYSQEEKDEILRNAYTSFTHGVDHFTKYAESENNVKFCILHIFNTVELLVKAYLGSTNKNLLVDNIDGNGKKTAGITVLLDRMDKFSQIAFDKKLRAAIDELRKRRNEIEHKKFVFEDQEGLMILLCQIINGLIVFARNHLHLDICTELTTGTKTKFDNARMAIDTHYREVINKIGEMKTDGWLIGECQVCLNPTVPYRKASIARCFLCEAEMKITKCDNCQTPVCGGYFFCDKCALEDDESNPQPDDWKEPPQNDLPKEDYS